MTFNMPGLGKHLPESDAPDQPQGAGPANHNSPWSPECRVASRALTPQSP